jgi:hypothetical protein
LEHNLFEQYSFEQYSFEQYSFEQNSFDQNSFETIFFRTKFFQTNSFEQNSFAQKRAALLPSFTEVTRACHWKRNEKRDLTGRQRANYSELKVAGSNPRPPEDWIMVARFFFVKHTKAGKNIPNDSKHFKMAIKYYQMAVKYSTWP